MKEKEIPDLDEVRKWIEEYGKRVVNIKDQKGKEMEIIKLRDRIEEALSFYRERGAFIAPEETRLGNLDAELRKIAPLFVKMVGAKTLEQERVKRNPPKERFYWWIDQIVREEKRKRTKKTLTSVTVALAVLLVLYFLVFRLPPAEKQYLDALYEAEQFIGAGKFEEALAKCEEALSIFQDRPTPYIMAGCISEKLGEAEKAQSYFQQAQKLYDTEAEFKLEKATWYFRVGMSEASKRTLGEILKEDPENVYALNLLGAIYEEENNIVEALKAYQKVLELAEEKGLDTLIPVTKTKIAMLQLKLPLSVP